MLPYGDNVFSSHFVAWRAFLSWSIHEPYGFFGVMVILFLLLKQRYKFKSLFVAGHSKLHRAIDFHGSRQNPTLAEQRQEATICISKLRIAQPIAWGDPYQFKQQFKLTILGLGVSAYSRLQYRPKCLFLRSLLQIALSFRPILRKDQSSDVPPTAYIWCPQIAFDRQEPCCLLTIVDRRYAVNVRIVCF